MARVLEKWPADRDQRNEAFPWEEWLDGRIWMITEGEDFHATIESMRQSIRFHAYRLGVKAKTKVVGSRSICLKAIGRADWRHRSRWVKRRL